MTVTSYSTVTTAMTADEI